MTNKEVLDALKKIKTYCSPDLLDKLDYAIAIIKKLDADGVQNPLKTDYTPLAKENR